MNSTKPFVSQPTKELVHNCILLLAVPLGPLRSRIFADKLLFRRKRCMGFLRSRESRVSLLCWRLQIWDEGVYSCVLTLSFYIIFTFFSFRYSYFLFPSVFLSPFVGLIKSAELLSCVFLLYWMSLGLRLGAWGTTVLPRLVSCISLNVFCPGRLSLWIPREWYFI